MANDLERFLQQAAERFAERTQPQEPPRQQVPNRPIRERERAEIDYAEIIEPDIIEPEIVSEVGIEAGPNRLSGIDTRHLATTQVDTSDDKMASHIHDVFDHKVGNLSESSRSKRLLATDKRGLRRLLQSPDGLRTAFIAGEIFRRKS